METSKKFQVLVEQVDRFSHEFTVYAVSEFRKLVQRLKSKKCWRKYLWIPAKTPTMELRLESRTFPGTIEIHTVESLFNINKEECNQGCYQRPNMCIGHISNGSFLHAQVDSIYNSIKVIK